MDWASSDSDDNDFSANLDNLQIIEDDKKPKGSGQKKQQKAKVEIQVPQDLTVQLTEQNTYCQICYKYALNAVICGNEKCIKMFCTKCAQSSKVIQQNKCPFCRVAPFNYSKCPYARKINNMRLPCSFCKKQFTLEEELIHYKQKCEALLAIQCRFCKLEFPSKKEIVEHTKKSHSDKIESIIESIYSCPPPEFDFKSILLRQKKYLDAMERRPLPGTTGKFYCGGKLETKCMCCNGYCGPTNGQNCLECMKLDVKRFGLPKGYLINSSGHICFKRGNDFVCGVRLHYQGTHCDEGNTCNSCKNMKRNIKRYESLL